MSNTASTTAAEPQQAFCRWQLKIDYATLSYYHHPKGIATMLDLGGEAVPEPQFGEEQFRFGELHLADIHALPHIEPVPEGAAGAIGHIAADRESGLVLMDRQDIDTFIHAVTASQSPLSIHAETIRTGAGVLIISDFWMFKQLL